MIAPARRAVKADPFTDRVGPWQRERMRALATLLLLAAPAAADVVGPGGRVIECYCTDAGGARVEIGQRICLSVDGRAFLALCDMSLNVPIWRDTGEGCLGAELPMTPTSTSKG